MEILIAMAIATMVVKNSAVDMTYAIRGKPSPRQVRALHRAAARRALTEARAARLGQKPPRKPGAFSSYMSQLWEDSWDDARSRHTVRRERRQSRPPRSRGAFRTYAAGVAGDQWRKWDRAWERRTENRRARTRPYEPVPNEVIVPGHTVPTENGKTDLQFGDDPHDPTAVRSCPLCHGTSIVDGRGCPGCLARQAARDAHWDSQPGNEPLLVGGAGSGKSRPMDHPATTPAPIPQDGQPTDPDTTKKGTTTMTAPATEVTGLTTAITNTAAVAEGAERWVPAIEQLSAGITAGGVGGNTTSYLAQAQEHLAAAAAALREAEQDLVRQLGVRDAYEANPDAGTREFVKAE